MKKIIAALLLCTSIQTLFAQDDDSAQSSLMNSARKLREWVSKKDFDATPYTEMVNKALNNSKSESYAQLYAKITLAWYYIMDANKAKRIESLYSIPLSSVKNSKIDFTDLYSTLVSARTYEKLADSCYLLCAYETGDYFYENKEYETAINAYTYAYECAKAMYKTDGFPKQCFRAYKMLGFAYFKIRNENAGFMQALAADCIPDNYPGRAAYYNQNIYSAATTYKIFENYEKADSCFSICEKHYEQYESDDKKAAFFQHRAETSKQLRHYEQAVTFYQKANRFESDLSKKIANITALSLIFDETGNRPLYFSTLNDGIDIIVANYKKLDKYQIFNFVAACNSENFSTKQYMDKLLSTVEYNRERNSVIDLAIMSYVQYAAGNYKKANNYKNEAVRLHDLGYDENNMKKKKERTDIVSLLSKIQDVQKMFEYQRQTLNRIERLVGKAHPLYINYSTTVASLDLMYNNNFDNAEKMSDSLMSVSENGSDNYFNALKLKAYAALYKGQNLKSADYFREIAEGTSNPREKFSMLLYCANFTCLEIMARQKDRNDKEETNRLISEMGKTVNEMSQIAEKSLSKSGSDYFDLLYSKGMLMFLKHDRTALMKIITQMESIEKQTDNLSIKQKQHTNLASLYAWYGDFEKALTFIKDNDPDIQKTDRNKYSNYLMFASMNLGAGNSTKAKDYYKKAVNYGISNVKEFFSFMTEAERSTYWDFFKQTFYNAGKYATVFNKDDEFNTTLYDMALYSKGLLMRSQNAVINKIKSLGDSTLLEDIQTIKQLRMAIANSKEGSEKQTMLIEDAERLEKQLLQTCAQKGYKLESEFCDYQQVKSKLTDKDAAIEFILYYDQDTVGHYGALILRKKYKYPIFVEISEKEKFEKELTFDDRTSQMVWNPIVPFLDGAEDIYFSPAGVIHKFAIEYLPYNGRGMIAEKFNIYRVSSTSELLKTGGQHSYNYHKAIIYGGINYATDTITMQEVVEEQTRSNSGKVSLSYLKGTLDEALTINDVFKNHNIKTEFYEDIFATEESFKQLSNKSNDIIHIGTHGFCNISENDLRLAVVGGGNTKVDVTYAMYNSGLFFAGCNNTLSGNSSSRIEDGILTSKEISELDFSKTNLITLSACVTGDGDITGEGVFGVQRGFKLAGANSLVMSCWNVDDKATNLLMSEFYTNLTNGINKRQSLLNAVKKTKEKFPTPQKWAAFVLLDGLN